MALSVKSSLADPGVTNSAPVVAFVVLPERNTTELAGWVIGVAGKSVGQGLRFCFCMPSQECDRIEASFAELNPPFDWTVIPLDAVSQYPAALAEVAKRYPQHDIIQITAGASLPFAWDVRLQKGATAEKQTAAATSMCDVDPMFALIDEDLQGHVAETLADRAAYTMGDRSYYEISRVHPICTYLRRSALDVVLPELAAMTGGPQMTLDILTRRLRAKGWNCVICDYLYVGFSTPAKIDIGTGDEIETSAYLQSHPLSVLRRSVNTALRGGLKTISVPGLDARPVQLHVTHFWGGGLEKWVRDFAEADDTRIHLVFSSYRIGETGGQRLVLYSNPADPSPIRVWDIAQPIRSTVSSSIEYRRILGQIIREFAVESIIVSSLIGHALDALDQPVKTLVVCHDFYPICQAINPQFETTCERCTLEDLRRCAKSNPLNSIFIDQTSEEWHAMRNLYVELLLENEIELVVPSPSVMTTLRRLEPRFQAINTHLIAHGISLAASPLPVATRTATEPLRIVVLGRLSKHKGAELLREAASELDGYAEVTLVGCGGNGVKLANVCGWRYIEKFEPAELPAILGRIAPHAGLLASVIPETFSYTLSELNQLGIPAIATALGSFNDRIAHGESGFLFKPNKSALIDLMQTLHAHPELLANVAERLSNQKSGRSVEEMVDDYQALIPAGQRPVARFKVGIGMQTGLSDPYKQLTQAYAQVRNAYGETKSAYDQTVAAYAKMETAYSQTEAAYTQTKAAYTQTRIALDVAQGEFERLRGIFDDWVVGYKALEADKYWWRIPKAMRLTDDFHEKINAFQSAAPAIVESPPIQDATKE